MAIDLEGREEEVWALLAWRVKLWTGMDHSSVTAERAQHILDSLLVTLELGEEALQGNNALVQGQVPLEELFLLGRKRTNVKRKVARQLWRKVLDTLPPTDNLCCRETLRDGMAAFFRVYEPEFSPAEIHITCDYPICVPAEGQGIVFIQTYLERAYQENLFCAPFDAQCLRQLWRRHGLGAEAIGNLFTPVLATALGCVLMGEDPRALAPSASGVARLQQGLLVKSRAQVEDLVAQALVRLAAALGLERRTLIRYLERAAMVVAADVFHGVERLTLGRVLMPV